MKSCCWPLPVRSAASSFRVTEFLESTWPPPVGIYWLVTCTAYVIRRIQHKLNENLTRKFERKLYFQKTNNPQQYSVEREKNFYFLCSVFILFLLSYTELADDLQSHCNLSLIHHNRVSIRKKTMFFHLLEVCCDYYAKLGFWDKEMKYIVFSSSLRFDFWLLLCNWLVSLIMHVSNVLKSRRALSHGHMLSIIKCAFVKW